MVGSDLIRCDACYVMPYDVMLMLMLMLMLPKR